jgi:hypothetical protein
LALSRHGHHDLSVDLALSENKPSWGYIVSSGAGTLTESWNFDPLVYGASKNHAYLGTISDWYYRVLGGINPDPDHPGFEHIVFKPVFSDRLDYVNVEYESVRGNISSYWIKENGVINHEIETPANTSTSYHIPEGFTLQSIAGSGEINPSYDHDEKILGLTNGYYNIKLKKEPIERGLNILFDGEDIEYLNFEKYTQDEVISINLTEQSRTPVRFKLLNNHPFFDMQNDRIIGKKPFANDTIIQLHTRAISELDSIDEFLEIRIRSEAQTTFDYPFLYPNPVGNDLNVLFEGSLPFILRYNIVGIDGQTYQIGLTRTTSNGFEIDTSQLPKGIYFLMFEADGEVLFTRFIKE